MEFAEGSRGMLRRAEAYSMTDKCGWRPGGLPPGARMHGVMPRERGEKKPLLDQGGWGPGGSPPGARTVSGLGGQKIN